MMVCLADQTEHESLKALHAHLRHFHIKQADYYVQYHPRKCLGTGQPIPFKDRDQYFSQDFVDKNAIKKFIKSSPAEAREWAIGWLKKRKEEKGLVYAPSQAELRSLQCPSMPYFDSVGGYYTICRELGFQDRYRDEPLVFADLSKATFIQDTREQSPIKISERVVIAKVNEGDYALTAPYDKGVYIERKSVNDFVGTISARSIKRIKGEDSNLARFDRELARASEQGHYIVMLVESPIAQALSFSYLPQMKWSKVSESHIWHNLRDLLVKYPLSFQVIFADGRVDASQKALKIFQMGNQVRRIDLQNAVEKGLL